MKRCAVIAAGLALFFLTGCATKQGAAVLLQVRAGQAVIVEKAATVEGAEEIGEIAAGCHDALSEVLALEYGVQEEGPDWNAEAMAVAVADMRDVHWARGLLLENIERLPYAGQVIGWGTAATTAITALIAGIAGWFASRRKKAAPRKG